MFYSYKICHLRFSGLDRDWGWSDDADFDIERYARNNNVLLWFNTQQYKLEKISFQWESNPCLRLSRRAPRTGLITQPELWRIYLSLDFLRLQIPTLECSIWRCHVLAYFRYISCEIKMSKRISSFDLKFLRNCDNFSRCCGKAVISPPGVVKRRLSSAKAYLNYRLRRTVRVSALRGWRARTSLHIRWFWVDSDGLEYDDAGSNWLLLYWFCYIYALCVLLNSAILSGTGVVDYLKDFYIL